MQAELKATIDLARELWPSWKPTDAQAGEWCSALARFDQAKVQMSIREHYRESKWREPRLQAVLKWLKENYGAGSGKAVRVVTGWDTLRMRLSHLYPNDAARFARMSDREIEIANAEQTLRYYQDSDKFGPQHECTLFQAKEVERLKRNLAADTGLLSEAMVR